MKIAYFDYWTEGIQNFIPFDSELRNRGHETVLLHLGSFYSVHPKEEVIEGITCRDISYYNTSMIYEMLEIEKPDIVIVLNTTKILDRVVTISCRELKIKSIYLMHGIRDLGADNDQLVALMEASYNSFWKKIKKIRKYLTIVIPNYAYAVFKYKPINVINLRFLRVVYSYFKNPGKAFYSPEFRDELLNDKCLVYSANEGKYYEKFGYNFQNITVVGNPKNDFLNDKIINSKYDVGMLPLRVRDLIQSGNKYALYLEESFPEQNNMGGYTEEIRDRFVKECAERLKKDNLILVVKLHPTTDESTIGADYENCITEKNNLDALIYFSDFCICSLSTTINNCVLMKKPVVMPQWYAGTNLPTFFVDAGVSNYWKSRDDELNLSVDEVKREEYIRDYITVVTPDAVKNVISAIGA